MEVLMLGAACLCAGTSAGLACRVAFTLMRRDRHHLAHLPRRALTKALALCEQLGHVPALIRMARMRPVASLARRLSSAVAPRGVRISEFGMVAALLLISLVLSALCIVIAHSLLGVPVALGLEALVCAGFLGRGERRERADALTQMPEVLRTLANALAAGKSLPQAIAFVGRSLGEPLGGQFLRTSFEIEGGRSTEEAIRALTERVQAPGMELLGTALAISQRTGSSLSDLFARTARMVASTCSLRRDLMVKTSQARLSAKVVSLLPVLLVGVLTLVSVDYRAGISVPAGRACLCVAALLDLLALWIIRRLMHRSLQ